MIKLMLRLFLFAACLWSCVDALSQVGPSSTMPPSFAIFIQGSAARLGSNVDQTQYGDMVYGATVGVYFQSRPWLGIDARILGLQSISQTGHEEHQRAAFIGPRFAHSHRRLKMYGVVLGGISHADYVSSPIVTYPNGQDVLTSATEAALQAGGGVDLRLTHRLFWRVGEVTYSHMFVPYGPSGMVFNSGLVLKIVRRES